MIGTYGVPVMSGEHTDNRRDLINPIMRGFPNQMGRGTCLWEPFTYDRPRFDRDGNAMTPDGSRDEYARIAAEHTVPSS